MQPFEACLAEIDASRISRSRELSDIRSEFSVGKADHRLPLYSRAAIVLAYANWEGFFNDCVRSYLRFQTERNVPVRDVDWRLLCGVLESGFDRLRDRHHSIRARLEFVENLAPAIEHGFDQFDEKILLAKSNLNFERFSHILYILGIDVSPFYRHRNWIDKELVAWRHSVAHGDQPDLSSLDIERHIEKVDSLLLDVSDAFQEKISVC
jgi:hypothetical protein